jgi:transposase
MVENTTISYSQLTLTMLIPLYSPTKGILTPYFRAFQLRCEVFRKAGKEALKTILETAL